MTMNKMSEQLGELFAALAKVQGKIKAASKDSENPFFKSKYATLDACWEACRSALCENQLSVIQSIQNDETGKLCLCSILGHSSGQYISSTLPINPAKNDPQSLGSAITYMRRYSLCSLIGITSGDDDDGEKAMEEHRKPKEMTYEAFVQKLKEIDPDEDFIGLSSYLKNLEEQNKVPVNKIMEQALAPALTKRFCTGWKKWRDEFHS